MTGDTKIKQIQVIYNNKLFLLLILINKLIVPSYA